MKDTDLTGFLGEIYCDNGWRVPNTEDTQKMFTLTAQMASDTSPAVLPQAIDEHIWCVAVV